MSAKSSGTRIFIIVIVVAFVLSSIGFSALVVWDLSRNKDDTAQQAEIEQQISQEEGDKLEGTQLENFTPVAKVDELQKIDIKPGDGAVVKEGATVTAHYTGAVASTGVIFQSSHDSGQPIPFSLNGVIKGWTEGVPGMKVGGTRRLVIPAELAYGANPPAGSNIPPNAALVFDIELVDVQQ